MSKPDSMKRTIAKASHWQPTAAYVAGYMIDKAVSGPS